MTEAVLEAGDPRTVPTFESVEPVVRELLGDRVVSHTSIDEGGYSAAGRWVVSLASGASAFVKAQLDPSNTYGLALEQRVYGEVDAAFLPQLLGYDPGDDGRRPRVLVTEDLSAAAWGAPINERAAHMLADAIDENGRCPRT